MLPFSLVLAYLSLIDIEDYSLAIAEMARVLAPGGSLLMANLPPSRATAIPRRWPEDQGSWLRGEDGALRHFAIDDAEANGRTGWLGRACADATIIARCRPLWWRFRAKD